MTGLVYENFSGLALSGSSAMIFSSYGRVDEYTGENSGLIGIWFLRTEIVPLPHFSEMYFADVRSLQPI